MRNLCHKIHEPWTKLLPTALLRVCVVPRSGLRLGLFEKTYGGPFLTTELGPEFDEEVNWALRYIINLGQVQKTIQDYA